jgi:hypothetical protein
MLHHDRWPAHKGTAGDDRKITRETKKDERVTEAKKDCDER